MVDWSNRGRTTAAAVVACLGLVVGGSSADDIAPSPYDPRPVPLGTSSSVEELSELGQGVVALAGGGFAVVWSAVEVDAGGVATGGRGLLELLDGSGRSELSEPVRLVASDTGVVRGAAAIAGDGDALYTAFIAQGDFVPGPGYPFELVVQRVEAGGFPSWTGDGVRVSLRDADLPVLVPVERGGVIVCFEDQRASDTRDVFCQKLESSGLWAWGFEPVRVGAPATRRRAHVAVTDKGGGVIVAWLEPAGRGLEVRAQRIDLDGARLWGDRGILVADTGLSSDVEPRGRQLGMVADGRGGVLLVFERAADGGGGGRRVEVERFGRDGLPVWNDPAVPGTGSMPSVRHEATVTDGFGSAFVVTTALDGGPDGVCRVTRVGPDGRMPWGAPGVELAGPGCRSGRAGFGRGVLVVTVSSRDRGRIFVRESGGDPIGPAGGHPASLADGVEPAGAAVSLQHERVLSLWHEVPPGRPWDVDVVGEVREMLPPPPRTPRGRVVPPAVAARPPD